MSEDPERTDRDAELDEEAAERQEIVVHANYEIFVLGLVILQLVNSVLYLMPIHSEKREIVVMFVFGISAFLIVDALARYRRTPNKRRYFVTYYGWLTWIGSLPLPFFSVARLTAMGLALRKLRRGEFREVGRVVVKRHAQSTLLLVIFLAIAFFEFGSLLILMAEQNAPDSNITTSQDALWWGVVTISTVGYGDTYPTTYWGRLIGLVLIISGVSLFTSITSFMARWFMRPRTSEEQKPAATDVPTGAQAQIHEIRSILENLEENHQQTVDELADRLEQLESLVAAQDGD